MNREIKFRVWDKEFKELLYGEENMISSSGKLYCNYDIGKLKAFPNNTYEIMQFTGLKDENGKEIYEGDIIENKNEIGVVEFDAGQFYIRECKSKIPMISNRIDCFTERDLGALYWDTVIGNIFENPELLK